jgi:hypothetical protein
MTKDIEDIEIGDIISYREGLFEKHHRICKGIIIKVIKLFDDKPVNLHVLWLGENRPSFYFPIFDKRIYSKLPYYRLKIISKGKERR